MLEHFSAKRPVLVHHASQIRTANVEEKRLFAVVFSTSTVMRRPNIYILCSSIQRHRPSAFFYANQEYVLVVQDHDYSRTPEDKASDAEKGKSLKAWYGCGHRSGKEGLCKQRRMMLYIIKAT
jgi:hypothetical protein